MVNFNGELLDNKHPLLSTDNRAFLYGDGLFETIRVLDGKTIFWEDHYLRLMASMRILRMEIPMNFTMEFLQQEILRTIEKNDSTKGSRIRITVFRNDGGYYLPDSREVSFLITSEPLEHPFYTLSETDCEVELYKDFTLSKSLLSNLKTTNRLINVLGSIYARENKMDNCILLNEDKMVAEVLDGNIFLVKGNTIHTPPLADGCLKGIIRKKLLEIIQKTDSLEMAEESISPFSLQQADELFFTNTIQGIVPVSKYRKKVYTKEVSRSLLGKLNAEARFS